LSAADRTNHAILKRMLGETVEENGFPQRTMLFTTYYGWHQGFVSMAGNLPFRTKADYQSYLTRIGQYPQLNDAALGITAVRPVLVQSQQRTTITVTARAERIGLTSVTVRPVTANGRPFGQAEVISVRATQYGLVGWLIVGVGVTVLFATSALRIARRLRARRAATTGPA